MTPSEFLAKILDPGIAWYSALPGWTVPTDDRARLMLLTIAGQESEWTYRVQGGNGPAHSFWQMERAGGVTGVLTHPTTKALASTVCSGAAVYDRSPPAVWRLMGTETGDNLSVAFARLLLWTDPHPLPELGDEQAAFDCYVRNWRPGAITEGGDRAIQARDRFHENYTEAMAAIKGEPVA